MISIKTYFSGLEETPPHSASPAKPNGPLRHNATVTYRTDGDPRSISAKALIVSSVSGNEFQVPILSPVTNLLPIPDGIIIEVPFSADDTPKQKLSRVCSQDASTRPSEFFYFTLTFHPLNHYRPLRLSALGMDFGLQAD